MHPGNANRVDRTDSRHGFLGYDGLANNWSKAFVVERFRKEAECPCGCQGGLTDGWVIPPADEDDARRRRIFPENRLHFQPIHVRHPDIEDRYPGRAIARCRRKKVMWDC